MTIRFSQAAALALGLGAASGFSEARAMDQRAPAAAPPAGIAESVPVPATPAPLAAVAAAPADPLRLRAGEASTFSMPPAARAPEAARAFSGGGADAAAASEPRLEIHFTDLQAASGSIPAVRVFLNKPDATAATSTEDPHFVGAISFFPLNPAAGASPSFTLPLGETLRRIGPIAPETAEVTLAPVDLGAGTAPPFEVRLLGMGVQ